MIQRIQSFYLLLAILISISLFFLPFSKIENSLQNSSITLKLDKTESIINTEITNDGSLILLALNLLLISALTYIIFLFKNRNSQIRLSMMTLIIDCVFLILIFYLTDHMSTDSSSDNIPKYLVGTYLVGIQAFLILMAQRAIRKDEQLIRSADRIR